MWKDQLKHFFIPHEGNNYKPHLLHTKRAVFYSLLFASMKAIVVVFALLVPTEVFLMPDVLSQQAATIIRLTNQVRSEKGLPPLTGEAVLFTSADARANDMAIHNYFSHVGPNGHTLSFFLRAAGYRYRVAGENLAMGFSDPSSVVNAWIKSPTHYLNLIDSDYTQLGVALVAGYFNGVPTIFVSQHFGDPPAPTLSSDDLFAPNSVTHAMSGSTMAKNIHGEKIVDITTTTTAVASTTSLITLDPVRSAVYWTDEGSSTKLDVRAVITGDVRAAIVLVQNFPIELRETAPGMYSGTLTVDQPSDSFFNPIITPGITIYGVDGTIQQGVIDWYDVKIVGKTPLQKYVQTKHYLSSAAGLFGVSNTIYWGFLGLFTVALIINIVVEARKQHYHIIAQTVLMIAFIGWLLWM